MRAATGPLQGSLATHLARGRRRGERDRHAMSRTNTVVEVHAGRVSDLHTFPVKGLRHVHLQRVQLADGGCFPHDRAWALMLGKYAHQWDPRQPEKLFDSEHHGTKVKFHQLISDPSLAELEVGYDVDKCQLQLSKAGKAVLDVCLTSPEGAADAEAFFESYLGDAVKASDVAGTKLRLVSGEGQKHQFTNVGGTEDMLRLHLVNRMSVEDFSTKVGKHVDPLRFRANILFDGVEPFEEYNWVGKHVRFGSAVLEITEPTIRCPATEVEPSGPDVGKRNMNPPEILQEAYPEAKSLDRSHTKVVPLGGPESRGGFLGLYARVVQGGAIAVGDKVVLE